MMKGYDMSVENNGSKIDFKSHKTKSDACSAIESGGCPHLEQAVERAIMKVFALLGVDVNDPESVEEFREDLRFGKRMRRMADRLTMAIVGAFGAAVLTAFLGGIVLLVKEGVSK